MSKFKEYAKNSIGRDFVCGDIHGCWDKLEDSLALVGFDKAHDRLFCVGDMVDRGPDSIKCLNYLRKPWFYTVMGNHEAMLCDYLIADVYSWQGRDTIELYMANGGRWIEDVSEDLKEELLDVIQKLPIAIQLEIDPGRHIGIVHAQVMDDSWMDVFAKTSSRLVNEHNWDINPSIAGYIWGREKITYESHTLHRFQGSVDGIEAIFHGHTILDTPINVGNCFYIDTGSYLLDRKITVLEIKTYLDDFHKL